MKKIFLITFLYGVVSSASAQLKKDGTPDMRYNSNKQLYGNSYSSSPNSSNTNSEIRYQSGYTRRNGAYVEPHYKTTNNSTNWDNYSTKNNYNPHNGTTGARAKDYSADAYNYGKGKAIHRGEKGGQYYYNSRGNKTYTPKRH